MNNLSLGTEYQGIERVHMGNGTNLHISDLGSSFMTVFNSINSKSFLHKKILHVPHIKKNMLYVSQLPSDNHVYFEFNSVL